MKNTPHTIEKPTKEQVRAGRAAAGQTLEQAAETAGLANLQRWYEYETGTRTMEATRWEIYLLKTNQHPTLKLNVRKCPKPMPSEGSPVERNLAIEPEPDHERERVAV